MSETKAGNCLVVDDLESSPDEQPSQKETQDPPMKTVHKYRHNIKAILSCSNATPFKTRGSDYACCFCKKMYSSAKDLKKHTLTVHTDRCEDPRIFWLAEFTVRLDITDLKCLICKKEINSLENLIIHLKKHGENYHTDIKNQIIPYKFDSDQFKCTQCDKVFTFLKLLMNHMSEHYANYECDECGKAFVSRHRLASHKAIHKKGEFKCAICPKVFSTNVNRNKHQRNVHVYSGKTYKCWKCDLFFVDPDQKSMHDVESHGVEPPSYKCNLCERTFQTRKARTNHINAFHFKRKPHKCEICDKSFAVKNKLANHMVTHTGEKNLNCPICNKAFALADYLRVHLKTHDRNGKLECHLCSRKVYNETRLKKHMRNIHFMDV